jgi:hypothetical protein
MDVAMIPTNMKTQAARVNLPTVLASMCPTPLPDEPALLDNR